jgi:pimeloyl-ACP methyl ester carboxylesterase
MGGGILVLRDRRSLAWEEYGDPNGTPCIYTPGTPASCVAGRLYHAAAAKAGMRWISPDKPGYGASDVQHARRLTQWDEDILQLADHLGLDRFAVAGESGGGPHALALAHDAPQRVTVALVISGMPPWDEKTMRDGMSRANFQMYELARDNPKQLERVLDELVLTLADPVRCEEWLRKVMEDAPPADREAYEKDPALLKTAIEAYTGALRNGAKAAVDELRMFTEPWGFSVGAIRVPVKVWHGTEDLNVPVNAVRALVARIPGCGARYVDGAGHSLHQHLDQIVVDLKRLPVRK